MKTLLMTIELVYDDDIMHGVDPESERWFRSVVLATGHDDPEGLTLNSRLIGDDIGTVRVISVSETEAE